MDTNGFAAVKVLTVESLNRATICLRATLRRGGRITRIWERTRLACMFESLAVASRPLQRRPRRNNLAISPQRTRITRRAERVPQIHTGSPVGCRHSFDIRRSSFGIFKTSVVSVNGADGIGDVEGKAARVAASSRGEVSEFHIRGSLLFSQIR